MVTQADTCCARAVPAALPRTPGGLRHAACTHKPARLALQHPKGKGPTYIGFTVNPRRRIRQHNGEITSGAAKTKRCAGLGRRPERTTDAQPARESRGARLAIELFAGEPCIGANMRQCAHTVACLGRPAL